MKGILIISAIILNFLAFFMSSYLNHLLGFSIFMPFILISMISLSIATTIKGGVDRRLVYVFILSIIIDLVDELVFDPFTYAIEEVIALFFGALLIFIIYKDV